MEITVKKGQIAIICMIIFLLTACAFSPADVTESPDAIAGTEKPVAEEEQTAEQEAEPKATPDIETENAFSDSVNVTGAPDATRAKELYEVFLNEEYAGYEDYAYVIYDADGDGCEELFIRGSNLKSLYIITFINGGLCIEYQREIPSGISELQWINMETLAAAQDREMTHSGIYVYVQKDDKDERYWYPNETDFVTENGFGEAEPFFEYSVPDGQKRLTLYYDEATRRGCGIRYYEWDQSTFITTGMYGFVFDGWRESEENRILEDYLKPESVDGTNGSNEVEDFTENTEYDAKGRITHYDADGILTFLKEDNTKPESILWIDYEYYDNGNLKSRSYYHNGYIFSTWYTTWDCFFDEQGRIAYEDIYITHGSWDTYYIYTDDTREPAYILDLDNCGDWIPTFWKGK